MEKVKLKSPDRGVVEAVAQESDDIQMLGRIASRNERGGE